MCIKLTACESVTSVSTSRTFGERNTVQFIRYIADRFKSKYIYNLVLDAVVKNFDKSGLQ